MIITSSILTPSRSNFQTRDRIDRNICAKHPFFNREIVRTTGSLDWRILFWTLQNIDTAIKEARVNNHGEEK